LWLPFGFYLLSLLGDPINILYSLWSWDYPFFFPRCQDNTEIIAWLLLGKALGWGHYLIVVVHPSLPEPLPCLLLSSLPSYEQINIPCCKLILVVSCLSFHCKLTLMAKITYLFCFNEESDLKLEYTGQYKCSFKAISRTRFWPGLGISLLLPLFIQADQSSLWCMDLFS
jgi:hypothetical protein